ncbi:uncharacterized protein si:dkey-238i5.2 [Pygocentrus nattereri]|uniref:uncharacterized protein si:dkey-238i5.2 n=1 Tax=Pygocentrus nattereri TaxID=42514 RepID=UPI0018915EFD|nr:uncharacterized protein si:dkey-238i5.2 [Pygocentrus nattereri]
MSKSEQTFGQSRDKEETVSEQRMKKIQPFTIGTKLSVPIGTKCQDYVDNILPAPVLDGCMLKSNRKDKMSFSHDQEEPTKHDPTPMEDSPEEEKGFLHPSASSRSIRKIAMCGSTETEGEFGAVDPCITTEPNQRHNSSEKLLEGRFVDKSLPHSESEPRRERKMKNLQYDYGIPAFPLEHPEDVSASQQRDLKDFENSLIQLTTYLDLKKDEGSALKKPNTAGFGVETLERRHGIGEHIDKLWLKSRSLLQDFQQDLMLALDVSSFYQQADIIISAINSKRSSLHVANVQGSIKENEGREIDSQIKMLNESAAQLSNLHPTLASRVTRKQAEVKESWALFQDALRNQIADVPSKPPVILPKGHVGSQTTSMESKYSAQLEPPGVMGKNVKEEQNRLRESECCQDPWIYRMLSPTEECCSRSRASLSEGSCCKVDNTNEKQIMGSERKDQQALPDSFTFQKPCKLYELLSDSTASAHQLTCSWLKDNMSMQSGVDRGHLKQSQEHTSTKIEELLVQVEVLWEGLRKRYEHGAEVEPAEKEFLLTDDVAERAVLKLPHSSCPPENVDVYSSGMLAKFLQHKTIHEMRKDIPALQNGSAVSECNEALLDVPGSPNVRECFLNHVQTNEELLNMQLSTLTLRINQHLSRCAELSMDMLDMETDMTMLCDPELIGLDGLLEEHNDLEVDYHLIEEEVEGMEILVKHLQVPLTEQSNLAEEVQSVLQAWEEAGRNMAENRECLDKFKQLRNYFENYLATILRKGQMN